MLAPRRMLAPRALVSARLPHRSLARRVVLFLALLSVSSSVHQGAKALPVNMDLNRPLQIGWYSLRVQNPFGTNYTGLIAIKSYDQAKKEFVFLNQKGEEIMIKEEDISFIYFRQLPDRSDVNVQTAGPIRNLRITPYKEYLYDIKPGRLVIRDGVLLINSRWRIAEQTPFDINVAQPSDEQRKGEEQLEIPRRIQLNYLGNHYLVETELVNILLHDAPIPGAGSVPSPIQSPFKNPPPPMAPNP
ncbi:MAG: hypothetical protein VKP70_07205 [Cyanobacteriota bacterium]|nr:hypothetical protein [Cyanobacteriota bacterium]